MKTRNRRTFLRHSVGAGLAAGAVFRNRAGNAAPSDRLTVGLMGCGGRGTQLVQWFAGRPDVDIKYLCDVDQRMFGRVTSGVEEITGKIPSRVTDFRRMLEDPDVDIIINATPDHWHGLGTIMACQAGKHVYVEKPASQNLWEGRKMVEAARKYNRVVQVGMQTNTMEYMNKAIEFIQSGKMGKIHGARVHQFRQMYRAFPPVKPVPEGLDYDLYCGPAQMVPYRPKPSYLMSFNFSGGQIFADAIHQLDIARRLIGRGHPRTVHHTGGILIEKDGRECPDTMTSTYEYDDLLLTFQGMLQCPYAQHNIRFNDPKKFNKDSFPADMFPDWVHDGTRVEVYGADAKMIFGRHGGGWQVFGRDGGVVAQEYGYHSTKDHIDNFIDCIRTGKRPNCDIEDGHISATLEHLANISFQAGNRYLKFDGRSETFPGDAEANALLKREYREPWVVPDKV